MLLGSSPSSKLFFFLDCPLLERGGGLRRRRRQRRGGVVVDEDEELSLFVFSYTLERPRTKRLRSSQGRVRAAPLYFFCTIGSCLDLRNGLNSGISTPIKSSRVQVQSCSIEQLESAWAREDDKDVLQLWAC